MLSKESLLLLLFLYFLVEIALQRNSKPKKKWFAKKKKTVETWKGFKTLKCHCKVGSSSTKSWLHACPKKRRSCSTTVWGEKKRHWVQLMQLPSMVENDSCNLQSLPLIKNIWKKLRKVKSKSLKSKTRKNFVRENGEL